MWDKKFITPAQPDSFWMGQIRRSAWLMVSANCKYWYFPSNPRLWLIILTMASPRSPGKFSPEWLSEKEIVYNQGFIAWNCWGQSSNHVVKSPHHTLVELDLGVTVGRSFQFFQFFSKTKGNMHKILLTKIIPLRIIYWTVPSLTMLW